MKPSISAVDDQRGLNLNGSLLTTIQEFAIKNHATIVKHRRHLHANPELSFKEFETSAYVKAQLDEIGVTWKSIANTGIVALIEGRNPGSKTVALRADMDALPILEQNDKLYKSKNEGVMHACGHDAHTSSLLGAAMILNSLKQYFEGTIKLIFQPGEEQLPGGASIMIREKVLENPSPVCIIGQHVMPTLEAGKIAVREGKHMASMDEIYVTITGKGGHSAQPHQNIDPVLICSTIINALQQIISRNADPSIPSVLSFGKIIANGSVNVTPDEVYMEGTFRTFDEKWRDEAHGRMIKIAEGIAESMGGKCNFNIKRGYPFLVNDQKTTASVKKLITEYIGKENLIEADIWMAAEDFAYYSQATNACFYLLGVGNKSKGIESSLHSATFDIDEKSLELGAGLMAYIAIRQLETQPE